MKYIIYEKSAYDVHSEWMVVLCRLYTMVTLPQPLQNQRRFCTRSFYYAIYRNPRTGCTDGILYFDKMKLFFQIFLILKLSWHTLEGIKRRYSIENVSSYRVLPKTSSLLVLRSLYKPLLLKH